MKATKTFLLTLLCSLSFSSFASHYDSMLKIYNEFSPHNLYQCQDDDQQEYCVGINFQGNNSSENSFAFLGDSSQFITVENAKLFEHDGQRINIVSRLRTPSLYLENISLTKNSEREISFEELDDRGKEAKVSIKLSRRNGSLSAWSERATVHLDCSKIN